MSLNSTISQRYVFVLYMLAFFLLSSCTVKNHNPQDLLLFEEYVENPEPIIRLYSVYPDGTHLQQLIEFKATNDYWVSPNNRYVALFSSWGHNDWPKQTLILMDLTSGKVIDRISDVGYLYPNVRRLYLSRNSIVWSPSSDKILFERNAVQGTGSTLWLYDLTTNLEIPLTSGNTLDREAAWSNNGQYIAYVSTFCAKSNDRCGQDNTVWNISVVKIDDQTIQTLTDIPTNSIAFDLGTGDAAFCNLIWSPDNKYIAFENQCFLGTISNKHRVFIVDMEDGFVEEVVKFEQPSAYIYSYHWTTENNLLTGYTKSDYLSQTFSKGGIVKFVPEQTHQTYSVELLGFHGSEISWSPNGKSFIAFTDEPIFELTQNGQFSASGTTLLGNLQDQNNLMISSKSKNLPHGICRGNIARWSVDGQYIAYSSIGQQHMCAQDIIELDIMIYSKINDQINNVTEALEGISKPISWTKLD